MNIFQIDYPSSVYLMWEERGKWKEKTEDEEKVGYIKFWFDFWFDY